MINDPRSLADIIPGLREAEDTERSAWDVAWLGLNESICGIEVKPYTARHDLILGWNGMRSPFLGGEIPNDPAGIVLAVQQFMWVVSPQFAFPTRARWERLKLRMKKRAFLKQVRRTDARKLIPAIRAYVVEVFADAPGGSGERQQSFHSWIATMINTFSNEYGWSKDAIIDMPLKQIFQLNKSLSRRYDPNCHLFKPSDRVIIAWLQEQNKQLPKDNQ